MKQEDADEAIKDRFENGGFNDWQPTLGDALLACSHKEEYLDDYASEYEFYEEWLGHIKIPTFFESYMGFKRDNVRDPDLMRRIDKVNGLAEKVNMIIADKKTNWESKLPRLSDLYNQAEKIFKEGEK